MNCTAFTYYVTLMAKHTCTLIASSVKIITKYVAVVCRLSQPGWFYVEIYMRVLGL